MIKEKVTKVVYNEETGDVLSSFSFDKKDKPEVISYKPRHHYAKVFHNKCPPFDNNTSYKFYLILLNHVEMYTNVLIYKNGLETRVLRKSDIMRELGKEERTVNRFLSDAKKNSVLFGVNTTSGYGYVINPAFAYYGIGISPFLFRIFSHDIVFNEELTQSIIREYTQKTGIDYKTHLFNKFPDIHRKIYGYKNRK